MLPQWHASQMVTGAAGSLEGPQQVRFASISVFLAEDFISTCAVSVAWPFAERFRLRFRLAQAYSDAQRGYVLQASSSTGQQSWNVPGDVGNSGHPSPGRHSRHSVAYGERGFANNGLSMGSQHGHDRYASAQALQSGGLNRSAADGFHSSEGGSLAISGRSYSNGEHNGDSGSLGSLWAFGSAGALSESGVWGSAGMPDQRAGRWEHARNGQPSGTDNYSSGGQQGRHASGGGAADGRPAAEHRRPGRQSLQRSRACRPTLDS